MRSACKHAIVAVIPFPVVVFLSSCFGGAAVSIAVAPLPDLPNEGGRERFTRSIRSCARADRASLQSEPQAPIEEQRNDHARKSKPQTPAAKNRSLSGLYYELRRVSRTRRECRCAHVRVALRSRIRRASRSRHRHTPPRASHWAKPRRNGDLTSACEQWQIARTAYLESGDTDQHARIEKRMRDNGCPTDWVLTDF